MNKKSDESIFSFLIDDQIITSAEEISNHINNFFTNVAEEKVLPSQKKHLSYLGVEKSNTIFLSPTLPEDIEDLVR